MTTFLPKLSYIKISSKRLNFLFYGISCKKYRQEFYHLLTRCHDVTHDSINFKSINRRNLITKDSSQRLRLNITVSNVHKEKLASNSSTQFHFLDKKSAILDTFKRGNKSWRQSEINYSHDNMCGLRIESYPCVNRMKKYRSNQRSDSLKSLPCLIQDKSKNTLHCQIQIELNWILNPTRFFQSSQFISKNKKMIDFEFFLIKLSKDSFI